MECIQEFVREGKNFIYLDFSELSASSELLSLIEEAKPVIAKYPEKSLYTISDFDRIRLDSLPKEVMSEFMEHNAPYVRYGAIIGLDGVKRLFANTLMKMSGRKNMHVAFSMEQAIEWLLKQD